MSGTMQCPSCKEQVDDDSRYCDQCGEQILVCSVCGRPGKGKRCIFDGKEMVVAGGAASITQTTQINQPQPVKISTQPTPAIQSQVQHVQQNPSIGDKIKLSSNSQGIMIEISDGEIIGRKNGPFTGIFGRFTTISGSHCKFTKMSGAWYIQDIGSTNGTFCNNIRLTPNTPIQLQNGSKIKIADVEFIATFDTNEGTVRI